MQMKKAIRAGKGKDLKCFLDNYVVLDLETTGLDPTQNEIIEIAAIRYRNGERQEAFNMLVKPQRRIDAFITQLTGISNEMVSGAPGIHEVLPRLMAFLGDAVIVAHNANFDINFLYDHYMRCFQLPFTNDYIDTMMISRRYFKNIRHRLADLTSAFGIVFDVQHRALTDCEATHLVYAYMRKYCEKATGNG